MKTIAKTVKNKSLVKPVGLFSFLPLGLTGGATLLFFEAWWPVALFNIPALWSAGSLYTNHAKWEIARLYAKAQNYDLSIEPGRRDYNEKLSDKIVQQTNALPVRKVYAAMLVKRPFEFTLDEKADETYGGSKAYTAVFDGKEVAVQKVNEPSVFAIWEDALVNARKLK